MRLQRNPFALQTVMGIKAIYSTPVMNLIKLPALLISGFLLVIAYLIDALQTRAASRPQPDTFDATDLPQTKRSDATRSANNFPASVNRNEPFSMRNHPVFFN